jgi:hypothetical protein
MLHLRTVTPELLELLRGLQQIPALAGYGLAGGTSLALQLGHRVSVDIDLFGEVPFEDEEVVPYLAQIGPFTLIKRSENIFVAVVQGIKVDLVRYAYPRLAPFVVEDGVRMFGLADIAAMKLGAIAGRGSRKDFIDLHVLMEHFSKEQLWEVYRAKFPDSSEFLLRKSLTYFTDAEREAMPEMHIPLIWEEVKRRVVEVAFTP